MQVPAGIQAVADHGALYAAIGQLRLAERLEAELGEYTWSGDLTEGWVRFTATADPTRTVESRAQFIASIAPGPRSLLWGWAHPQAADASAAQRLQDLGQQHALADLTTPEVSFTVGQDIAADIDQFAHAVGAAAVEATGTIPYYLAPVGGGTRVVLLLPDIELRAVGLAVDGTRLMSAFAEAATTHRRHSLLGFARHNGYALQSDETMDVVSDGLGTSVTATWDPQGGLINLQMTSQSDTPGQPA
ncbi:MAG: DUF6882 domain-containing protein [Beutenbergiaceae bacterium]